MREDAADDQDGVGGGRGGIWEARERNERKPMTLHLSPAQHPLELAQSHNRGEILKG